MNKIVEKLKTDDNYCFLSESPDAEPKYVILSASENMELYGYLLDKIPETLFDCRCIECDCIKKENNVYMLHRLDGPAFIWKNNANILSDALSNLIDVINDDAIIPIKKDVEKQKYYIDGKNYSEQQFWCV